MLVLAVTLHNIPEGIAVGVMFAGFLIGNTAITITAAFVLAIGMALQNFPEGAIISMPLKAEGLSKNRSFFYGILSRISRTNSCFIYYIFSYISYTIITIFIIFCSWCYDLCCCRRINS